MIEELICVKGCEDIVALDPYKITITKSCLVSDSSVIGIDADKAASEISKRMKDALKERKKLHVTIRAGDVEDNLVTFGSFNLVMSSRKNLVITKTDFCDKATIGVRANKAARDLSRELVKAMRVPDALIEIILRVDA